jgi:hypothetical protein
MASLIISTMGNYTFGALTNRMIGGMISANAAMRRLQDAITTASAGYDGTPGTQFEIVTTTPGGLQNNLFGVVASDTPGEQGATYRYAMEQLNVAWLQFWAAAQPYIEQLDNGQGTM